MLEQHRFELFGSTSTRVFQGVRTTVLRLPWLAESADAEQRIQHSLLSKAKKGFLNHMQLPVPRVI